MTALVVSVHDVAPATFERSVRLVKILESRGVRASLLVIPGVWKGHGPLSDDRFAAWLREVEGRGHEIIQHGLHHVAVHSRGGLRTRLGHLIGRGCEEFWELSSSEAYELAREGRLRLSAVGIRPKGFIAPAWLASRGTMRALRELEFEFSTTHSRIVDLGSATSVRSFALSQRPGSSMTLFAAVIVRLLGFSIMRSGGVVRVAMHPDDLDSNIALWSSLRTIDDAIRSGRPSVTYGEVVVRSRRTSGEPSANDFAMRFA